jgi:endonuclease/exonuclease/phosphatase family metal-dependent hydrolase
MDKMTSEHKEQYILGDFNIDLQSSKSKSTTFSKRVRHLGLKQLVTVPTRTEARYLDWTFHITSTLIDQIYCSSESNVASIHIPPLSLSDRSAINPASYNTDYYLTISSSLIIHEQISE